MNIQEGLSKAIQKITSFYDDRKLTLRNTQIGCYNILYDNRVAFLGSIEENSKKPQDGKSIVFCCIEYQTFVVQCTWKDGLLIQDYPVLFRILKGRLSELGIPLIHILEKVMIGEDNSKFWDLGQDL